QPADMQDGDDSEHVLIVVTGTATPVEYEKIGNTITVIGGEAIEARGTAYLQDVLREVPGVAVNQGGSFGSQTHVRSRGAEGNHVLAPVPGIEVSAIGSGELDFSPLLAHNTVPGERLRGPQSGPAGADALAGLINVIPKAGDAPAFDADV